MRPFAALLILALTAGCSSAGTAPSATTDDRSAAPTQAAASTTPPSQASAEAPGASQAEGADLDGLTVELKTAEWGGPGSQDVNFMHSLGNVTNERNDQAAVVHLAWEANVGGAMSANELVDDVQRLTSDGMFLLPGETLTAVIRSGAPMLTVEPRVVAVQWYPLAADVTNETTQINVTLHFADATDPTTLEGASVSTNSDHDLTVAGCLVHVGPATTEGTTGAAFDCTVVAPLLVPAGAGVEMPLPQTEWRALGAFDAQDGVEGEYNIQPMLWLTGDQPDLFD